jgi:hypothetical protein
MAKSDEAPTDKASPAAKPKSRHREELGEYMRALAEERRKHADTSGYLLNHQAITGERRDELAAAAGICVNAEDWWDRSAEEQHKTLLGKISVLRTPPSAGVACVAEVARKMRERAHDLEVEGLQFGNELAFLDEQASALEAVAPSATGERLAVAERLLRKAMPRLSRTYEACQYDADYMAIKDFLDATVGPRGERP